MTSEIIERHVACENCGSSDAKCVYEDGHSYCFSCHNYSPGNRSVSNDFTYEYLPWRGVHKETMEAYGVKTKINSLGLPVSLGFQYSNGSFKVRTFQEKNFYSVGDISKAGLFGRDKFASGSNSFVIITEGELDALSFHQVARVPVVSVQSAGTAVRDCTVDRSWLNGFDRIYLAFDGDAPGREATEAVARLFARDKLYQVRFDKRKDANDFLQHGEGNELLTVFRNSKRYLPETIKSSLSDFASILSEKKREGVPYPFPTLNEMTYGMRRGESVLITAQEGVGKTEMMHAIEYQLLRSTSDRVAAIFLEEPQRRHLQAVAGIHLGRPAHLPDSGVDDATVVRSLQEVLGMDDRLFLYSHFGSVDPEPLIDTCRFLVSGCGVNWLLLDHITMAVSGANEADERRALDYLSTQLEMMVKELEFGLIVVSHVNDFGQTRGSRYISKIADIRIDLDRDVANGDQETKVRVTKNRFCGRTGPAGILRFNPATYSYTEAANDNIHPETQRLAV